MEFLAALQQGFALRRAPTASPALVAALKNQFEFATEAHVAVLGHAWFVLTTVAMTALWEARSDTAHMGLVWTPVEMAEQVWRNGIRQTRAVSEHITRCRETRETGVALWQCVHVLEHAPTVTKRERKQPHLYFDGRG